jgi:hypothetical protein
MSADDRWAFTQALARALHGTAIDTDTITLSGADAAPPPRLVHTRPL